MAASRAMVSNLGIVFSFSMISNFGSARRSQRICLIFFVACLTQLCWGQQSSAARAEESALDYDFPYQRLDWLPRHKFSQVNDPKLEQVPQFCKGTFYDRAPSKQQQETGLVVAEAQNADHRPGQTSTLSGNVQVSQDNRRFQSDQIIFDHRSNRATIPGAAVFRERGLLILGQNAIIDMLQNKVSIEDAEYVMHNSHIHGSAKKLEKDQHITLIDHGLYTACPPDERHVWQLKSQKMKLNHATGWGQAKHVRLEILNVPLFYIPYFKFPIDDRRQSGFLYPNIGTAERGGLDFTLPYYFNLAPNYDLTYSPRIINRRGTLHQGEFRYLNGFGEGQLAFAQLNDDKKVEKNKAEAAGASAVDIPNNRKTAALKHEGQYGERWVSRIDALYASDEEYFQDFGADFSVSNRSHLNRLAELTYSGETWDFSTKLQGFQTIDDDIAETSRPYFQLPLIQLNAQHPIKDWLQLSLESEYVYFDRDVDDSSTNTSANTTGQRLRINPALSMPLQNLWGFVIPSIKLKHSQYQLKDHNHPNASPSITVPVFSLDSGIYLERDLKWRNNNYLQTLDPRIYLLSAAEKPQDELPNFDTSELTHSYNQLFRDGRFSGGDRIGDHKQISLGIGSSIFEADSGQEQFQFLVGQSFYLEDRQVTLINDHSNSEQSPISGEMRVNLNEQWKLRSSFSWDADRNIRQENSIAATYLPGNGKLLHMEVRSREREEQDNALQASKTQQSKLSFAWPLKTQWSLFGHWYFNLDEQDELRGNTTLESFLGIEYENCCLQARLLNHRFLRQIEDQLQPRRQLMLQLQLKGLGNLDDKVSAIIARTIPDYNERFRSFN